MASSVKKRHRRTKAELLQDPEYCRKHGIKRVKLQKVATSSENKTEKDTTSTKKVEKAASESKKRHRRTRAELIQDPAYRKKHGLDVEKTVDRPCMEKTGDRVLDLELEYLPKMYRAWENVQSLMNELDRELNLRIQPKELMHFDFACSRMEEAFTKLETEINKR